MKSAKYLVLYEDFDPVTAKKKISQRLQKIKDKMISHQEKLKKAAKSKDLTLQDIVKTKIEIDKLEIHKLELQDKIIDLTTQRQKEKAMAQLKAAKEK